MAPGSSPTSPRWPAAEADSARSRASAPPPIRRYPAGTLALPESGPWPGKQRPSVRLPASVPEPAQPGPGVPGPGWTDRAASWRPYRPAGSPSPGCRGGPGWSSTRELRHERHRLQRRAGKDRVRAERAERAERDRRARAARHRVLGGDLRGDRRRHAQGPSTSGVYPPAFVFRHAYLQLSGPAVKAAGQGAAGASAGPVKRTSQPFPGPFTENGLIWLASRSILGNDSGPHIGARRCPDTGSWPAGTLWRPRRRWTWWPGGEAGGGSARRTPWRPGCRSRTPGRPRRGPVQVAGGEVLSRFHCIWPARLPTLGR